jgi:hypothetical protein
MHAKTNFNKMQQHLGKGKQQVNERGCGTVKDENEATSLPLLSTLNACLSFVDAYGRIRPMLIAPTESRGPSAL